MTAKLQWVAATRTAPKIRDRLVTAEDIRPRLHAGSRQHLRRGASGLFEWPGWTQSRGRSDDKTSRSNGPNHLRGSLSMHHGCSSRALQRRHSPIRSSNTSTRGKSERGIDGTSIGRRATGSPANAGVLATSEGAQRAKERLQAKFSAAMARAKRLDAWGDRTGCTRALSVAKRMYIL
jgi:hypothetical protein